MIQNQIGNTFTIEWPINIIESEESNISLSDLNLTLYIVCERFRKQLPITIEDSTVVFTFEGKDQVVRGAYSLELYVNEGLDDQVLVKQKDAFYLYR